MKTISDYTIHCTEEQTKRALKLGAPVEKERIGTCIQYGIPHLTNNNEENEYDYKLPTAEQLTGWLEEQGLRISIDQPNDVNDSSWYFIVYKKQDVACGYQYLSRSEVTLASIDAALDYLTNNKK